jgi:hypothetical protein
LLQAVPNLRGMAGSSSMRAPAGAARPTPFGEVLRGLLIEHGYTTGIGNPDWPRFALELDGIRYESLRKAVTRERAPSVKIMEACAKRLGVEPTIFWEYQLAHVRRAFDQREVGEDEAFANLQRWKKLGQATGRARNVRPDVSTRRRASSASRRSSKSP